MTTIKDVRNLLRPLLERRPELVLIGRFVFIKPVYHLLRGVYVGGSGFNPKSFRARRTIQLLVPDGGHRGAGDRLREKLEDGTSTAYWDITRPESMTQLVETVDEILTAFTGITTLEDYYDYVRGIGGFWPETYAIKECEVLMPVLEGDFELAINILKNYPDVLYDLNQREPSFHQALLAGDRAEVVRILHEWEEATVMRCRIEKIWQRTPFPLELEGRR